MTKLPITNENEEDKEPTTDLSSFDLEKIEKFKEEGLPGVASIDDVKLAKMMSLYLEGKPYTQISRILGVKKPLVLYFSQKFGWYNARREYLHELEATIRNRIVESKIISQDFLLQLTALWQKKIGKKITEYLRTEDDSHADKINLKEIDKYLKTIEMLYKIQADGPNAKKPLAPAVGLNLGDGVSVKKINENEVEITPKNKTIGDMLKQFADYRRESNKSPDIEGEEKESEGEKDES